MSDAFGKHLRTIAESADAALRDTHEAREHALTLSRRIVRSSANLHQGGASGRAGRGTQAGGRGV